MIRLSNQLDEDRVIELLIHERVPAFSWNFEIERNALSRKMPPNEFQAMSHGPGW